MCLALLKTLFLIVLPDLCPSIRVRPLEGITKMQRSVIYHGFLTQIPTPAYQVCIMGENTLLQPARRGTTS